MHQPCKSNTGKYRSYLPLSFAANAALKASNQPKPKNQPPALSTTSVVALRYSFAAGAAQLADSTRARKVKTRLQHLIRSRYYDPRIGRFTSQDRAGFHEGVNFFTYVHNNPIILTDPFGEVCDVKIWKAPMHAGTSGNESAYGHWWLSWPGHAPGFGPAAGAQPGLNTCVSGRVSDPDGYASNPPAGTMSSDATWSLVNVIRGDYNCCKVHQCLEDFANHWSPLYCFPTRTCREFVRQALATCGLGM